MSIPESVTFEEAIARTQSLISQIPGGELSSSQISEAISQLVQSEFGARGFFVTYLTSEGTEADHPSPEVIQALQSSPNIVPEVLVKTLAMSAAQAITHRRNGNEEMALGSEQVRSRTTHLIQQLNLPQVRDRAVALHQSVATGEGAYKTFLERWGYDAQQRQLICEALEQVISSEK